MSAMLRMKDTELGEQLYYRDKGQRAKACPPRIFVRCHLFKGSNGWADVACW